MFLRMTRFVSLVCAALALGLTVTRDLEIPGKHLLSGANWLLVQQTLYGGCAIVAGVAEALGLISTGVLIYLLRKRRTAFILMLVAAIGFAGMLALFAFSNSPLNQQILPWTPETLPVNWRQIRDAWDSFYAASSALAALTLTVLLIATLRDTPFSGIPTSELVLIQHHYSR